MNVFMVIVNGYGKLVFEDVDGNRLSMNDRATNQS